MKEQGVDFADDWLHKLGRYWVEVLALFADLAAVVAIGAAFYTNHGESLIAVYILVFLSVLWILLIVQEYRYARKSSYAESLRHIHAVVHFLRDTAEEVSSMPEAELRRSLERALGDFAMAFTLVTRTSCRACIKVLSVTPRAPADWDTQPEPIRYLVVRTFARDLTTASEPHTETADWVTENTDFFEVFDKPEQRCFFENDLKKRHSRGLYRNSHLPLGYDNRRDLWPLPYRSTIVWPIRLLRPETKPEVLGFLCIDSRSRRVFVRRYDFDLGALVADGLYMYMINHKKSLN
jgi:hypothetical protein